jgi:hypothetical protein
MYMNWKPEPQESTNYFYFAIGGGPKGRS